MNCDSCQKHILENQETRTRGDTSYHLSCAPEAPLSLLFREMQAVQINFDVEFRFALIGFNSEVRIIKNGVRLSKHSARNPELALDASLESWRRGKISADDLKQIVELGGHGIDCPFCEK